jgi:fructose-bisphosphate aldolase class I
MDEQQLNETAAAIVAEGKGILAADESDGTIKTRFDSIGIDSTEEHRRPTATCSSRPRESRSTSAGSSSSTRRSASRRPTGRRSRSCSSRRASSRDQGRQGAKPLALAEGETDHRGPRRTAARLEEYRELGARFTKWRGVISIGKNIPSEYCLWTNAHALARFAALSQEAGLVRSSSPRC